MTPEIVADLIADIGMSEGNDTDFYLKKGFRVVGVEADPRSCAALRERFSEALAADRLRIVPRAAWERSGEVVTFLAQDRHQGGSHVVGAGGEERNQGETISVETIDWPDIVATMGLPYYCKVDIEKAEPIFLRSFAASGLLPAYFSVEVHSFEPVEILYRAGYRRFKLINQTLHQTFRQPNPALEGCFVPKHKFVHASGLFGRELPGNRWLDFRETAVAYETIQRVRSLGTALAGWFDCHATMAD